MRNREFVMLAQSLKDRSKVEPSNFLCSVKLDGMRAIWLPHTRGKPFSAFDWANRARDKRAHICTGLWSRYAKPIFCPDYFVERLPTNMVLDGELYAGAGDFQKAMSAVKKLVPVEEEWGNVDYNIFDRPNLESVFREGQINNPNYIHKVIRHSMDDYNIYKDQYETSSMRFESTYYSLLRLFEGYQNHSPWIKVHPQKRLLSWKTIDEMFDEEIANDGEGVMMRRMTSIWEPYRSPHLLKIKGWDDAEGIILGWKAGIGKYEGMMGSLVIRMEDGCEFNLSGFTDAERQLSEQPLLDGTDATAMRPTYFQPGHTITYKFRELTDDGLPKDARYFRKHMEI